MSNQFRENYTPEPAKRTRMSVVLAAVYITAAFVLAMDLFVWRIA